MLIPSVFHVTISKIKTFKRFFLFTYLCAVIRNVCPIRITLRRIYVINLFNYYFEGRQYERQVPIMTKT